MRITGEPSISQVDSLDDLKRYLAIYLAKLPQVLNGQVTFGDNIRSAGPLTVTFDYSGQVVAVNHNLNYVPAGYWVVYQNAAVIVYAADFGAYPWTNTQIFLTANGAAIAKVIVF